MKGKVKKLLAIILACLISLQFITPIMASESEKADTASLNPVELKDKRDLFSKHFRNKDGSFTLKTSEIPQHYKDKGEFKDIDLSIISKKHESFEYSSEKNNFRVFLNSAKDVRNSPLSRFEMTNAQGIKRYVEYTMLDIKPVKETLNGNKITYSNIRKDMDLEYIVTPLGLKEKMTMPLTQ